MNQKKYISPLNNHSMVNHSMVMLAITFNVKFSLLQISSTFVMTRPFSVMEIFLQESVKNKMLRQCYRMMTYTRTNKDLVTCASEY
jgi:hypothetical protein